MYAALSAFIIIPSYEGLKPNEKFKFDLTTPPASAVNAA